jgi:hypothetical protein
LNCFGGVYYSADFGKYKENDNKNSYDYFNIIYALVFTKTDIMQRLLYSTSRGAIPSCFPTYLITTVSALSANAAS